MLHRRFTSVSVTAIAALYITAANSADASSDTKPERVNGDSERTEALYRETGIARRLQEMRLEQEDALLRGEEPTLDTVEFKMLVIMGAFIDEDPIFDSSDFQELLFGSNPTGSLTDYYREVSYGRFELSGQVFGPYTVPETREFYDTTTGPPNNFAGFAYSLLDSADQYIDFGEFDSDGPDGIPNSGDDDGIVDAVHFIFPDTGAGASRFSGKFAFFGMDAHGVYVSNDPRTGGGSIILDEFLTTAEKRKPSNLDLINPIGGPAHEFGHAIGLPDQYDTDYSTRGVGSWCLMGYGTRGACDCYDGLARPIHLCAWCKEYLGFLYPIVVEGVDTVSIPPIGDNPVAYKLWDHPYQAERYFLIENRTKFGFDSDILGEGLLIWHFNGDAIDNKVDHFRLLDLEEADGLAELDTRASKMDAGDVYPGSTNNTSFNDGTNPSALDVYWSPTGVSVEEIAYTAGPGSAVSAILTQRNIEGFTLSYNKWSRMKPLNSSGATVTTYEAMRFTTPQVGILDGIQVGVKSNQTYDYAIRVFEDMAGSAPAGLIGSSSGTFPTLSSKRYLDVSLANSIALSSGQTFLIDVALGPAVKPLQVGYANPSTQKSYWSEDGVTYTLLTTYDVPLRALLKFGCCEVTGDADNDGAFNIADVTFGIARIFSGGAAPACQDEADADGDNSFNIADVTYGIAHIFSGGPAPVCGTTGI